VRDAAWASTGEQAKAIRVGGPDEWERLWPRLTDGRSEFVVQELVQGPESAIESYHAYVDAAGAIAGEFTGRKIRTFPPHYGYSTAVEIVDLPDVARLGREVLGRVGCGGSPRPTSSATSGGGCICSRSTPASPSGSIPPRSPG
jgi:predicted ATP-grasp superfamily ATP-dependent carboligase